MVKRVTLVAAALVLTTIGLAYGGPTPISGSFFKGPAVGGDDRFVSPNVLQVRGEKGFGNLNGGVLTGSADYTINEEIVNFAGGVGTFHAEVAVTTADGSVITLHLSGFTSGVDFTAQTVTVSGSWTVVSVVGSAAPLHGEGQFTGIEQFPSGETQGAFSGLIH